MSTEMIILKQHQETLIQARANLKRIADRAHEELEGCFDPIYQPDDIERYVLNIEGAINMLDRAKLILMRAKK